MNAVTVLIRRHFLEARWMLGLSATAFFLMAWFAAWRASAFERLIDSGEFNPAARGYGFLKLLGGSNMDYSTTALEVCVWNHPLVILTVLAWVVARASGAVAGEIERGTIDVTLTRPVSRSAYLTSQILFAVLGLVVLVCALIAGSVGASFVYTLKAPPSVLTLLKPATIVVTLGMAVYGYTLPFSTIDVVRWRPALASSAITLAGLVAMSFAPQFPDYEKLLKNLSVFQLYAPVTVAMKGEPLGWNASMLTLVFLAGMVVSYVLLARRDLPSNS
jgi:ABC-2 type transport system permease protein